MSFDLANLFFAGVSAVASAIQIWQATRDQHKAAKGFDETYNKTLNSPEAKEAAQELVAIIPPEVIKDLESRADFCWTSYRKVLGGDYLPDEIDNATGSVQACVCRELVRINNLNGSIPPRWTDQWQRFRCAQRGQHVGQVAVSR